MRVISILTAILIASVQVYAEKSAFPYQPDLQKTPGELCAEADQYRYPERIAYCNRKVDTKLKAEIIKEYDSDLGYSIQTMPRTKFKIDHFIPLCMGGSNDRTNLWPQHESVYEITDALEPALCEKMAQGKLLQADAIDMIKRGKTHLDEVPAILAKVKGL